MMERKFTVRTQQNGWSIIEGPNDYCEGPYRYRWEAEEFADKLERGLIEMEKRRESH